MESAWNLPLFTLLASVIGIVITYSISINNLRDSLDSKSGWRCELYNLASKDKLTLEDVYRLKASIRFAKHDEKKVKIYSFKFMTNVIFNICDEYIKEYENDSDKSNPILDYNHREIIRICARYLLKYHWDFNSSGKIFRGVLKDSRQSKYDIYAKITCQQIKGKHGVIRID